MKAHEHSQAENCGAAMFVLWQGGAVLEEQDWLVAACAAQAFTVQLGGAEGIAKGWGQCLGVVVDAEQARVRSQLGNVLAARSEEAGLAPVAVVAYREVGGCVACSGGAALTGLGTEWLASVFMACGCVMVFIGKVGAEHGM